MIAPSTVTLRPMWVPASTTERSTRARSRSVEFAPRTVCGPMLASGAIRQFVPMNAGPSIWSRSSRSTPSPSQMLPRSWIPGMFSCDLAVECVVVRLAILVEVADVLPVAVHHVAVERTSHLEQQREKLLREVVRPIGRHVPQNLRIEHVDAGVDRVGEDLTPRGLLEEALDAPVLVRDDDPELERVFDRLEPDRDRSSLVVVRLDDRSRGRHRRARRRR